VGRSGGGNATAQAVCNIAKADKIDDRIKRRTRALRTERRVRERFSITCIVIEFYTRCLVRGEESKPAEQWHCIPPVPLSDSM